MGLRHRRALAVLLALAIAVQLRSAQAHMPHSGLNFWLEVPVVPGCDTKHGDATCALTPGGTFTVNVNLGALPSDIPSYDGFDIYITYGGVAPVGQPSTDAWPDCAFFAIGPPHHGQWGFGCATGLPPAGPSTYTGTIATLQFGCTQPGSIVLHNGDGDTDLVDDRAYVHTEPTATETLNITCGSALARFADVNCDSSVNSLDALLILQVSARLSDSLPCLQNADANDDGAVDAVDAALVLQADAGLLALPPPFPVTPTATPNGRIQ